MYYNISKNNNFLSYPIFTISCESNFSEKYTWVFFQVTPEQADLPQTIRAATEKVIPWILLVCAQFVAETVTITEVFDY